MPKTIGIIGYGSFGQFVHMLAKVHYPNVRVFVWDRNAPNNDEITFFSFEKACSADVVVLAVAISALEEIIVRAAPCIRDGAVLIDVSTVKTYPLSLLVQYMQGKKYIAMHPMFGPYSYIKKGKTLRGLRIVITGHSLDDSEFGNVKEGFALLGLSVLEMTADEHDKVLAETLFLTHYIGQIVASAGFVRTSIDTLSFGSLMDAVESVKHDKKLFEEVYRFNPYCERTIERFEDAERAVRKTL